MGVFALSTVLVPLGLSCLPPLIRLYRDGVAGLGFLCGWSVTILVLFLADVARIPLHLAAWTLCLAAAAGLAFALAARRQSLDVGAVARHPLTLLTLTVFGAIQLSAPVGYEIYAWDSWTNWVGWARQMVVADAVYRPDMWIATRGDTPGWPLAMALPGLIGGRFSVESAWAAAISLHIGLLAVFFDVARMVFHRSAGMPPARAILFAWVFLLALLGIELSWSLVPTLLLVEEPQYYVLATGFLAVAAGLYRMSRDGRLVAAAILMMATAYLVKMSLVVFVPGFVIAVAWWLVRADGAWRLDRRAMTGVSAAVLSMLCLIAVWKLVAPPGRCQADIAGMVTRLLSDAPVHGVPFASFAGEVGGRLLAFALDWKLPVTAAAALGFLVFAKRAVLWMAVAVLAITWLLFYAGMVTGMASCFGQAELEQLASVQRYSRVPLRLTQTVGVFLLLIAGCAAASRLSPHLGRLSPSPRLATAGAVAAIVVLGAWQTVALTRSIAHVRDRPNIDSAFQRRVQSAKSDVRLLAGMPGTGDAKPVRIVYFTVPPYVERVAANYHGLGAVRGGPLRRVIAESYPLAPTGPTLDEIRRRLPGLDALVFTDSPGAAISAFAGIGAALSACEKGAAGFLLLRTGTGNAVDCRPRRTNYH